MLEKPKDGQWRLPGLSHDELKYWGQGLFPLPFQACWYEFVINNCRSGLLIVQDMADKPPGTYLYRLDFVEGDIVLFDGVLLYIGSVVEDGLRYSLSGNTYMIDSLKAQGKLWVNVIMNGPLAIYLTMMLNSRTTEIETVEPPKFLNRKKVKRGVTPLPYASGRAYRPGQVPGASGARGHGGAATSPATLAAVPLTPLRPPDR